MILRLNLIYSFGHFVATTVIFWSVFVGDFRRASATVFEWTCNCNLPSCTFNVCTTRTGCFQELPRGDDERTLNDGEFRYGCLELWPDESVTYQCAEPGIRKISGQFQQRRLNDDSHYDFSGAQTDLRRSGTSRRRYGHQQQRKHHDFRPVHVPLRCCFEEMCNGGNRFAKNRKKFEKYSSTSMVETTTVAPPVEASTISAKLAPSPTAWWLTSTMLAVPILGVVSFILLLFVGCTVLNCNGGNVLSSSSRYYIYEGENNNSVCADAETNAVLGGKNVEITKLFDTSKLSNNYKYVAFVAVVAKNDEDVFARDVVRVENETI